jgi:HlyD family secretion protein
VFRKKWPWVVGLLVVLGVAAGAYSRSRQEKGTLITAETVQKRDLEAIVTASGKIEPKRSVNISAQSMGRVTRIGVREGDRVTAGQFLLQIDPVAVESAVRRDEAAVAGARTGLEQSRVQVQSAQAGLDVARQALKRQRELWEGGLTTRENVEKAEADVQMRESDLNARVQEIKTREEQVRQQEAGLTSSRYNLSQARFESPFDGIVTRRNIEEGENVVVGTMNNAGTVLLTVADMSVIEAEVEVDETDIPLVQIGQKATVTIDAIDGRTFSGRVTEIGNSPIQPAGSGAAAASAQRTATNFKVVVTLDAGAPEIRPGFTCTADISTASRSAVLAVPIQSLTVRELEYDRAGVVVPKLRPPPPSRWSFGRPAAAAGPVTPTELPVGHTRKEVEGVFVVKNGKAIFTPVAIGIAGERYFEVAKGLSQGDRVITGPFDSVRNLFDADDVREAPVAAAPPPTS